MKEQILDFITEHPYVLALLPFLATFVIVRRIRKFKRRTEHINDPGSKVMLVLGFVGAAILLAIYLAYF